MKFKTGDKIKLIINDENVQYFASYMKGFNKNKTYKVSAIHSATCIRIKEDTSELVICENRFELAPDKYPKVIVLLSSEKEFEQTRILINKPTASSWEKGKAFRILHGKFISFGLVNGCYRFTSYKDYKRINFSEITDWSEYIKNYVKPVQKVHPRLIAEVQLYDEKAAQFLKEYSGPFDNIKLSEGEFHNNLRDLFIWNQKSQGYNFWSSLNNDVGIVNLDSPIPVALETKQAEKCFPDEFGIHCATIEQIDTINKHYDVKKSQAHAGKNFASKYKANSATIYISKRSGTYFKTGWNINKNADSNIIYEYAEWLAFVDKRRLKELEVNYPKKESFSTFDWPCINCGMTKFKVYLLTLDVCVECGQLRDNKLKQDLPKAGKEKQMERTTFKTTTTHQINGCNVDSMEKQQFLSAISACEIEINKLEEIMSDSKAVKACIKSQKDCLKNIVKHFDSKFG